MWDAGHRVDTRNFEPGSRGRTGEQPSTKGEQMMRKNEMTFDEALCRVIEYMREDELKHYECCAPEERGDHIWMAIETLMKRPGIAELLSARFDAYMAAIRARYGLGVTDAAPVQND
jgi:hypothetical protein